MIETRGRSGEAVAGATVRLEFAVTIGDVRPSKYLHSDDRGQVRLGQLDHVRQLHYGIVNHTQHQFDLDLDQQVWPSAVHLSTSDDLRLPLVDGGDVTDFRLLETRAGKDQADRSSLLHFENGFLTASELPAGDLRLVDRRNGNSIRIAVVDGRAIDHILVGRVRHRQQSVAVPLSIEAIRQNDGGSLTIQLSGCLLYTSDAADD